MAFVSDFKLMCFLFIRDNVRASTETIRELRRSGKMSVKKICETMKVSRSVFYRCINQVD